MHSKIEVRMLFSGVNNNTFCQSSSRYQNLDWAQISLTYPTFARLRESAEKRRVRQTVVPQRGASSLWTVTLSW